MANPAHTRPESRNHVRVPGNHPSGINEPARFRLMRHAHVCQTTGDSVRLSQARAGKGVIPLN